ncbi:TPA_asm: protein 5 [Didymochlaena virus 1]|uniref:Protein 5 n=1 Tax=Didymochlaena virus 1 TaxID=2977966 RepID=A0A9N6YJD1_9RHAB|nr:TPA_asm: protein 5 [Didymochlaena virus 1]
MSWITETLGFVGPHLISMVQDAINRWNPEIPLQSVGDYRVSLEEISEKMSPLGIRVSPKMLSGPPSINHLESLHQSIVGKYDELVVNTLQSLMSNEFLGNTKTYPEGDFKLHQIREKFKSSIKCCMDTTLQFGSHLQSVRLIDDAITALTRMSHNKRMAESGFLVLRDWTSFLVLYSDEVVMGTPMGPNTEPAWVSDVYHIMNRAHHPKKQKCTVSYVPKLHILTEDIFRRIYNRELSSVTMYDILCLIPPIEHNWLLMHDNNLNPAALVDKVVGSSMTSLSIIVIELITWCSYMLVQAAPNMTIPGAANSVRFNSWLAVPDLMTYSCPWLLHKTMSQNPPSQGAFERDTTRILTLLHAYRVWTVNKSKTGGSL